MPVLGLDLISPSPSGFCCNALATSPLSHWFVAGPRYPNFQYYPNSDAYLYDTTAQACWWVQVLKRAISALPAVRFMPYF